MDIVVTIPKTTDIDVLYDEITDTIDGEVYKNIKIPSFPKYCKIGDKCHILYNGEYIGFMNVIGFEEKEFQCVKTDDQFKDIFVVLTGGIHLGENFHQLNTKKIKGFQGYRYFDVWKDQLL